MLIEKPTNPIAFIIDYLIKTYPDQAKLASGLHGIGSASKNDLLNIEPPSPQQQMWVSTFLSKHNSIALFTSCLQFIP